MSDDLRPGQVPMTTDNSGGGGEDFISQVPEEYREKEYMKGIDSMDSLLKTFDNAQSLIGKKTVGIPTQEDPPEKWSEFYNKMGRPESPDNYEFEKVEMPEGINLPEEMSESFRKVLHDAGLTQTQAKQLKKAYDENMLEQYQKLKADQDAQFEEMNNEFESMLDKHFGDRKDEAAERVNKLLADHAPAEFKDHLSQLDNKNLMLMTTVLDNIHKKYIGEGRIPEGDSTNSDTTVESLRAEGQKLMKSDAWKNPMDTQHDATKKRVGEIYKEVARLQGQSVKK